MIVTSLVAITLTLHPGVPTPSWLSLAPPEPDDPPVEDAPPVENAPPVEAEPPDLDTAEPLPDPPPPPELPSATDYPSTLERVRAAQLLANEDPARGSERLAEALELLANYPAELASDVDGQRVRAIAQLTLARSLLALDRGDEARDVMDEAIRTGAGESLPVDEFGPGLRALHEERRATLDRLGRASLAIQCHQPCRIFVNEKTLAANSGEGLILGTYRVRVESLDGGTPALVEQVTLERADQTLVVEFGTPPVAAEPIDLPAPTRMLPRAVEITALVMGLGAIGAGAALLAIHDRCPGGGDALATQCPRVRDTQAGGIALLSSGGALAIIGGITLGIDEVRVGRERGRQATLGWSLRF